MATQFNILAWRISMDRGAWQATVHGVARVGHDLATKPPPSKRLRDRSLSRQLGACVLATLVKSI